MTHVKLVEREDAPEELHASYDLVTKKLGAMLNFYKAMANAPDVLTAFLGLNRTQGKTALDPKLRELAYLRVSVINACEYCIHYHTKAFKMVGWGDSDVNEVVKPEVGGSFAPIERDVIAFAEQVTRTCRASDDVMARLKQSLNDRQLVELTATVALANYTNRFNVALGIELP